MDDGDGSGTPPAMRDHEARVAAEMRANLRRRKAQARARAAAAKADQAVAGSTDER